MENWLANHWFEVSVLVLLVLNIIIVGNCPSGNGLRKNFVSLAGGLDETMRKLEKLEEGLETIKREIRSLN